MLFKLVALRMLWLVLLVVGLTMLFFCGKVFGQDRARSGAIPELSTESWDYKIVTLPVVVGIFHGFDGDNLSVALNKEHTKLETVNLKKIQAVYLLQGNKEKLGNYLLGGIGGGALFFSGFMVKNKLWTESDGQLFSKESAMGTSLGVGVGLIVAWWQNRGVEDVRPWPVYSLDIYQSDPGAPGKLNYRDPRNLDKILAGSFIQVIISGPE